jgi:hypothetical protein
MVRPKQNENLTMRVKEIENELNTMKIEKLKKSENM